VIRWVIFIECIVFLGAVAGFMLFQRWRDEDAKAHYPIPRRPFVIGKITMGISWGILPVQAARGRLHTWPLPELRQYMAALLLLVGTALSIAAFAKLGSRIGFGTSDGQKGLSTTGVYRISRNPMFTGFYLVTLASMLAVPHLVNICCGIVTTAIHHRIVLAEERSLLEQYGADYEAYKHKVRRYL